MTWQPIETAPHDGTPILLVDPEGNIGIGIIETVNYGDGERIRGRTAAWVGTRRFEESASIWMGGHNPTEATHWMSLPEKP